MFVIVVEIKAFLSQVLLKTLPVLINSFLQTTEVLGTPARLGPYMEGGSPPSLFGPPYSGCWKWTSCLKLAVTVTTSPWG